jgi:dihydrofolate synthase/folylpolyglutamate synthase
VPSDPLAYLFSLEQFGIKFGLENISALVRELGNPQDAFASAHIAGTNGKGSVTAMIDAMLRAAGHRCARYTSPHLVDLRERFVIDGTLVELPKLEAAIDRVRAAVESLQQRGALDVHPTFFEVTTAVAFELFREAGITVAVCEVGLGGRLDATNVLQPRATAITSIALDHEQYLGSSLAAIAFEKAGIIKPAVPVVVGRVAPDARAVIARVASERSAPLVWADESASVTRDPADPTGLTVRARTERRNYGAFRLPLAGAHQLDNAAVAIRAVELLEDTGIAVGERGVIGGLSNLRWPGRLERVTLPGGREALLDAAHNPAGAAALASYLQRLGQPRPLVFAAMRDKNADGILRVLGPAVSAIVITRATNPRSADPHALAAVARRAAPGVPVELADNSSDALRRAFDRAPHIVVAGSIFLLGDVIGALRSS